MQETLMNATPTASKPFVATGLATGMVEVSVTVSAAPERVWQALTEPALVRLWFGELSGPLSQGASQRLDFEDGDYFTLSDIRCRPPNRLEYRWRFLGTGPRDTIVWDIEPGPDGSRVTVTDSESARAPENVTELEDGWSDFLGRLQRHLATGEITRYDWRRDFDGAIELPVSVEQASERLLAEESHGLWLPFGATALAEGEMAMVPDGLAPERFELSKVDWRSPTSVRFELAAPGWARGTNCRLEIKPHRDGAILVVSHNGWENIGADNAYHMAQRKRFGELWIEALQRARRLVG